ncbi:hypothetical protein D9619_011001 [Psilocybe cf. subviscida]|uniref:Nephrocystin 3-like N-terminal domain-containing protein n=1 Tax=Psilocybe cf. subviscida TaxID=2480587 RepID=A0A8H5F0F8_9AGAR|nr:hypothetical protein D9619_011001 [Psilocybe cf. subviscida]
MASMFKGASRVSISGGTFNITSNDQKTFMANTALKDLGLAASHNAFHDSVARYDAPKCHPNTRIAVLNMIEHWIHGLADVQSPLLWLYGGAGAAKSAIVQSIAERCIPQDIVLGCFFFSRTDVTRNSAVTLIPTLAYQVARAFPAALAVIEGVMNSDPLIFSSSLRRQAYELLVRPLRHLASSGVITKARAFLIDGLDECNDPKLQTAVIDVIVELLLQYSLPVVFLVASRPEQQITAALSAQPISYTSIPLSDHIDSEADIRRYIDDMFHHISIQHPFKDQLSAPWPPPATVDELVRKSSGHFIYASTAMKYIMSPHDTPWHSLQVVLGLQAPRNRKQMPFSDLDALYQHILNSATYLDEVLTILARCLLADALIDSVDEIAFVLGYAPNDIYVFIADLQALLTIVNRADLSHVNLRHASLRDFLLDKSRAVALHIDYHAYHTRYVARYFQLFDLAAKESPESTIYHKIISSGNIAYGIDRLITDIEHSMHWVEVTPAVVQLFWRHGPSEVWDFCASFHSSSPEIVTGTLIRYMNLVEDVVGSKLDGRLYSHHLATYITIVFSFMNSRGALSRISLPLIFSGFPTRFMRKILVSYLEDYICYHLVSHLHHKDGLPVAERRLELASAIYKHLTPTVQLTEVARILLRKLRGLREHLIPAYHTLHERWLRRTKPFKHVACGSPRLARRIQKHSWTWLFSQEFYLNNAVPALRLSARRCRKIWNTHCGYPLLLEALAHVLPLTDPSEELVELTRKMLPRAALHFQLPMRRARDAMDVYTARVRGTRLALLERQIEEGDYSLCLLFPLQYRSANALLERLRLCNLDEID